MIRITAGTVGLIKKFIVRFGVFRFPLPDLGEKIKEGRVKKLYVREGDRVTEFQKLADVESDKQFTEISSPEEGVIKKLYYREDQTCQVGDVFLDIETKGGEEVTIPPKRQQKIDKIKEQKTTQPVKLVVEDILTSATVRMWARQHHIDLRDVLGTGRKGRILKEDIIGYIQARKQQPIKAKIIPQSRIFPVKEVTKVKMDATQIQQLKIATYSATIPHLFLQQTFDVTDLMPIIETAQSNKQNISLLSLLIKAFSLALVEHPKINSIYKADNPYRFNTVAQQHLLLPIYGKTGVNYTFISNLQRFSIVDIEGRLQKAKEGKNIWESTKEILSKATISLSFIGQAGVMVMNPPVLGETICHASIGSVRQVVVSSQGIQFKRQQVNIVLGADHRVIDGASCARFTKSWKLYSQNPSMSFLNMI